METILANPHLFFGINQGLGEQLNLFFRAFEDIESKALSCFGADTGEPLKLFDETGKGRGINGVLLRADKISEPYLTVSLVVDLPRKV